MPNSIKKISFLKYNPYYNKNLNCLPESVEYIKLPQNYKLQIKKFPLNLKTIECEKEYSFVNDFSKYEVITYWKILIFILKIYD